MIPLLFSNMGWAGLTHRSMILGPSQSNWAYRPNLATSKVYCLYLLLGWCRTVFFGVYKCWGPGASKVKGVSWAKELEFEEAHPFLVKSFVNGRHWIAPSDA